MRLRSEKVYITARSLLPMYILYNQKHTVIKNNRMNTQ